MKFIVKFLVSRLSPKDLCDLGSDLMRAGNAARARQAAISEALQHVRNGVNKLTL